KLGTFPFPHDAPDGGTGFVLMGSQAYKDLTAANRPDPDFIIPNGLIVPSGSVCFANTPENASFFINSCLTVPATPPAGITPTASGLPAPGCGASPGFTSCSGTCVNTQTNTANCGTCGHACGAGI